MSKRIILASCAKINFYLDVLDHREDGFNNIETIFQTVSLADRLNVEAIADTLEFHCDDPDLAAEPDNLVLRSARALRATTGVTQGARMLLEKRIPIAAGLAGGSGDAAAALTGLNALWETDVAPEDLAEIALALGSDVPYCLRGGTAYATSRGEFISPLPEIPKTWLVLVHPSVKVSAAWVYRHPQLQRSPELPVNGKTPSFSRALDALASGDLAGAVFNRMESVVFAEHPELARWKAQLLERGCTAAAMSGSGPTLYGVCKDESTAREVAATFAGAPATAVHTVPHGVEIHTEGTSPCS